MWNNKAKCGLVIVTAACLMAGCSLLPKEEEPLKPPLAQPAELKISTVEVKRESIATSVKGTAYLESVSKAYHQFTQSGFRLEEVLVSSGDEVKQGDVLMSLEVPGLEMELLSKNLEVEKKAQALEEVKASGDRDRMKIAMMELQLAQMSLETTQEKWNTRELKSEIDGVVTFVDSLKPGDWVDAYRALVIVEDPTELTLSLNVASSNQVTEVELGMDVKVTLNRQEYTGTVVQTPSSAPFVEDERLREKYAKTLYIDMNEFPPDAEIGDMATVEILTAVSENALLIPKNALRQYFGRTYVQILEDDQRREVDVETGLESATSVEILDGLEEGQLVIEK